MAADINLSDYNSVARLLLKAFDDSEISEREGSGGKMFSYVPPERYRYRLLQVFGNGYEFHVKDIVEGKMGVRGIAYFIGEVPEEGIRYAITAPCFEPWGKKSDGTIFAPEQTYQKLISAGLKAVSREMGLGLHLYDKAQRRGTTTTTSSKPASAPAASGAVGDGGGIPNFDPEWDGSEKVTFGTKMKGDPWSTADDEYLEYLTRDPEKANKKALKEIARRQSVAGQSGNASAAKAMESSSGDGGDDDEFSF